jgi:flavin-binding protein dodecin
VNDLAVPVLAYNEDGILLKHQAAHDILRKTHRRYLMSVAKVIEVLAEGDTIEEALQSAVTEAAKTVRSIKHVYVEGIQAKVKDDEIVKYRVNTKLTFVVD